MRYALQDAAIVLITVVAMEGVASLVHRVVMHGWGWGWHRSHHEPRVGVFERNDLYALVFAAIACALFTAAAGQMWTPLYWIGVGMTVYGLLYAALHDGLVHERWPLRVVVRHTYLKRLVQAHRLHHAVHSRDGAVSFGFLYAPPVHRVRAQLQRRQGSRQ